MKKENNGIGICSIVFLVDTEMGTYMCTESEY